MPSRKNLLLGLQNCGEVDVDTLFADHKLDPADPRVAELRRDIDKFCLDCTVTQYRGIFVERMIRSFLAEQ